MQNMNPGLQSARGRAHAHRSRMLIASVKKKKEKNLESCWAKYRQRFYVS